MNAEASGGAGSGPTEAGFRGEVVLDNGSAVMLRSIHPDDGTRLVELAGRCSDRTLYYRFFSPPPLPITDEAVARLVGVDGDRRVALVATLGSGGDERIVAVGRWDVLEDDATSAEVAFLVEDAYQGLGLGTALLEHLAAMAPRHGIRRFEAEVLGDNRAMLHVFGRSGYRVTHELDAGIYHVVFPIHPTPESLGAAATRERDALAAGLAPFCEPRSVAVVGAGRDPRSVGGSIVRNVLRGGFTGAVSPVNPRADAVAGVAAYDEVSDLPPGIDLAVVAVPAQESLAVVDACGEAGIKGVLVAAAGFDAELEAALVECCRSHGMRLLGPASMGVVNTDPRVSLRLVAGTVDVAPGVVGMAAQTGALGIGVLDHLRALNLGVSQFVSLGNRADVSSNDLLAYWEEQEATRVVLLYLESFGNPRRFVRLARRVARKKPIAVVAVGETAALAAERGLFRQAGVIRTRSLEELVDVAGLLAVQPVPHGRRVAVVSNAGGAARIAAAALGEAGLELAQLSADTLERLASFTAPLGPPANPLELPPVSDDESRFAAVLDALGTDPSVDAVLVVYTPMHKAAADRVGRAIVSASRRAPEVTFVANFLSSRGLPDVLRQGRVAVPSFLFPESAAVALGHAAAYGTWLAQPEGEPLRPDGVDRDVVRKVLAGEPVGELSRDAAEAVLAGAGVDLADRPHGVPFVVVLDDDAVFGPVLGLGAGLDVGDVTPECHRLTPLTDTDAARLVSTALAVAREDLDRGTVDTDALRDLLLRLSALAVEQDQIRSLVLDPVIVGAPGEGLRVTSIRISKHEPRWPAPVDPAGGVG